MKKIICLLSLSLFITSFVFADMGPKPTMNFNLSYETTNPVSLTGAKLMQCKDEECLKAHPLMAVGPQGFACTQTTCHALAYGFAPYQKVVIDFSDKTRESKIFKVEDDYDMKYNVVVTDNSLVIEEISSHKPKNFFQKMITLWNNIKNGK